MCGRQFAQERLTTLISTTIATKKVAVLEACCGLGKTRGAIRGYLNAAEGRKLIYAVRTHKQAAQVIEELRRSGVSYALQVSRAKACTHPVLAPMLKRGSGDHDVETSDAIAEWCAEDKCADWRKADAIDIEDALPPTTIESALAQKTTAGCAWRLSKRYQKRNRASVVTHEHFIRAGKTGRQSAVVFVDEAHQFCSSLHENAVKYRTRKSVPGSGVEL